MLITMDTALFIAIVFLVFIFGLLSGIKIAYAKMIVKLLKMMPPKEFEKFMEDDDESSTSSINTRI